VCSASDGLARELCLLIAQDNAQTYEGKNIPMEISGKKSPDGQLIKLMGSVIAPMIPAIIDAKVPPPNHE